MHKLTKNKVAGRLPAETLTAALRWPFFYVPATFGYIFAPAPVWSPAIRLRTFASVGEIPRQDSGHFLFVQH